MSLDFNPSSYTPDGVAVFGDDSKLLVKFFVHAEISPIKSKAEGRPVHDDVVMVSVIQPGEKEEVKVLANDWHKARFPKQWDAFEKGHAQTISGTRLEFLFPGEPSTILMLNGFNVFTVEQLAGLSDTGMNNVPRGRSLAVRAQEYLQSAGSGSAFHQIEAMKQETAELRAALEEMRQRAEDADRQTEELPKRRGPGRPPRAIEGE